MGHNLGVNDTVVMNLTAFEPLFEEKRRFFLEDKNIFSFDIDECKYVLLKVPVAAAIDQQTMGATFNIDSNITNNLWHQYYG